MADHRKQLLNATGEPWVQMGSSYICRTDVPDKAADISEALRTRAGIETEMVGRNAVRVNRGDLQGITPQSILSIRDYLDGGVENNASISDARRQGRNR